MAGMSRREMAREADKADKAAVKFERAANDADAWASGSSGRERAQAVATARVHRENAAEYRNAAEQLRDGELPERW